MATILVVDDHAHMRVYLGTVLGYQERHEVVSATDGVVGLWTFEKALPDLVIVDLEMPYLGGIHLIERLTAVHPSSKIIAMSGGAPDRLEEAEHAGAMASLRKPFDRNELLAAVKSAFTTKGSPAPRRAVQSPVELTFDRSALRLFGESRNMSQTGMLILSEGSKPPRTSVRFSFAEFQGRATVVWRREAHDVGLLGMKFTALGQQDRASLVRILRESALRN